MARVCLAAFSDTHGGHKHGLMHLGVELEDLSTGELVKWTPAPTEGQRYLWNLYNEHILQAGIMAGEDELLPMHNGDITQGSKFPEQLVSNEISDQLTIGAWNMLPWFDLGNVVRLMLTAGTGSHEFGAGGASYECAKALRGMRQGYEITVAFHLLVEAAGICADVSHHGPHPGSRIWLKGNMARYYLRDLMMRDILAGREPPGLVIRSHFHEPVIERVRVNGFESVIVVTPAYSLPGSWTRQATRSLEAVHNGMLVFEIENGKLVNIHELVERLDLRTRVAWVSTE